MYKTSWKVRAGRGGVFVRKIQTHPRCVTFNTFRKERAHTKKRTEHIYIYKTHVKN